MDKTTFDILKHDPNRCLDKHEIAYMIASTPEVVKRKVENFKGSFKIMNKWVMSYGDVIKMIQDAKKEYTKHEVP